MPDEQPQRAEITGVADVTERYALEHTRMSLDAGFLGKIFGSASNAPTNIGGLVVVLFSLTVVALLFLPLHVSVRDALQVCVPVITLVLGYLFGSRR